MFLLGAALTLATAYAIGVRLFGKLPLPAVVRFAPGAAIGSALVYLFFLVGFGKLLPVLAIFLPFLFLVRPKPFSEPAAQPLDRLTRWFVLPSLAVFGLYYLVHAMAPEIQPDAIAYHLGLVAEYLRLGHFPHRIGFYEILPQGLEMLFAMAFSIGGASAAKLVHYGFLLATLPLIVLTARRLKLTDAQGTLAAALYFFAPVVGLSGTCAYNDAALVFFTLSTFYLLLLWRHTDLIAYAACAGITAGFCYAIKFTGLLVVPLGLLFLLLTQRKLRPAVPFSIGAALMVAPWMLRAFILTRDPLAPLFNNLFPNLYFNAVSERALSHALSSYQGFSWPTSLWVWGITGATQGVAGPLILAAPLALLAPIAFNVGTRFLMQSLPFFALALAVALPGPVLLALTALQAVICFPPVVLHLEQPQAWALKALPWRAALRLQPEAEYLASATGDYTVARFIEDHTKPRDRVFALNGISTLFTTREVLEFWHSNRAQRLTADLQAAYSHSLTVKTRAEWPPLLLSGIRFVSTADYPNEWSIFDVRLFSPGGFLYNSPQWTLQASPNPSDAPAAFDGNRVTFWTTRIPQRRGMYLEADFDHPQLLNAAQFLIAANAPQPGFRIEGRSIQARTWQTLTDRFEGKVLPAQDLRRDAVHALHQAGFAVISVFANGDGLGKIGQDIIRNPAAWSLQDLGSIGDFHLLRIVEP
jgi:uncharacterized membrane protein YhaH (DUF805 family)